MHKEVRELVEKAKLIGFHNTGKDGNGHYVLVNENGQTQRVPSTPSEYRSLDNAVSAMERKSGRKIPRQNAAKYSYKRVRSSDFSRSSSEHMGIERRNKVIDEAEALRHEIYELAAGPITRGSASRARRLIERFGQKRDLLNQHCCVIPDLNL